MLIVDFLLVKLLVFYGKFADETYTKVKGSKRLKKAYKTLAKLQKKKADIRREFIQKLSTQIVNNHDIVIVEDLKITNMTKSAKGTVEEPGKK